MSRARRAAPVLLTLIVGASACQDHEFEPPDPDLRVSNAEQAFTALRFDTVTWTSDSIRSLEGNVVYSSSCRNCHGPLGEGGTEYAEQRDLDVPSLVEADWRWAEEPDSVRRRVFVGHVQGMPSWGITGLGVREIDAVTHYLLDELRPEMLGGSGGGTSDDR